MRDEGVVLPPFFGRRLVCAFRQTNILLKIAEPIELAEPYSQIPGYYEKDDS